MFPKPLLKVLGHPLVMPSKINTFYYIYVIHINQNLTFPARLLVGKSNLSSQVIPNSKHFIPYIPVGQAGIQLNYGASGVQS